jgi:hypothetical protein
LRRAILSTKRLRSIDTVAKTGSKLKESAPAGGPVNVLVIDWVERPSNN